jgi:hypothetical protein
MDLIALLPPLDIINDFHDPIIMAITNSIIPISRDFVVLLGHRSSDSVRVEISRGRDVAEADDVAVFEVSQFAVGVVWFLFPGRENQPFVVVVLVVIAGDLLLV